MRMQKNKRKSDTIIKTKMQAFQTRIEARPLDEADALEAILVEPDTWEAIACL